MITHLIIIIRKHHVIAIRDRNYCYYCVVSYLFSYILEMCAFVHLFTSIVNATIEVSTNLSLIINSLMMIPLISSCTWAAFHNYGTCKPDCWIAVVFDLLKQHSSNGSSPLPYVGRTICVSQWLHSIDNPVFGLGSTIVAFPH